MASVLPPSSDPKHLEKIDAVIGHCLADVDPAVRRAAAQCVGLTCELLGPTYAAKFVAGAQAKLMDAKGREEARSGYALALGRLARAAFAQGAEAGGAAPLKRVVQLLAEVASSDAATPLTTEWASHALASVATAVAGGEVPHADFRPLGSPCLKVATSLCLAEPAPNAYTAAAIARLSTAIISTLTSDQAVPSAAAAGGKHAEQLATVVRRCGVVHAAACHLASTSTLLQAEWLSYACATLALPPALLPQHATVSHRLELPGAVLGALRSHNLALRRAAIAAQRAVLSATEAASGGAPSTALDKGASGAREKLVKAIFELLDFEESEEALEEAKVLLLESLDTTADREPSFWVKQLRGVALEIKKEKDKGDEPRGGGGGGGGGDEGDGEEGGGEGASGLPSGDSTEEGEAARRAQKELEMEAEEAKKWQHVALRWQTRLVAVECVRRLLAVLEQPAHFDLYLERAKKEAGETADCLCGRLAELVSVAFTAAAFPVEAMRPAGVAIVLDLADKFATAGDPDYEGHIILELYSAQISAALRPCFAPEAQPDLMAIGCAATARFLLALGTSARGHQVDPAAVRKLLALLTNAAEPKAIMALNFPEYSERAATMVRVAALHGAAQVWHACAARPAEHMELTKQLAPALGGLRDAWLALLRDFSLLDTAPKASRRLYRPYLYVPAMARAAHEQLHGAWLTVLGAVVASARTAVWPLGREQAVQIALEAPAAATEEAGAVEPMPIKTRPLIEDMQLLIGLCSHRLHAYAAMRGDDVQPEALDEAFAEVLLCLQAIPPLLPAPDAAAPSAALPALGFLRLVELLRAVIGAPHVTLAVLLAASQVAADLCVSAAPYCRAGGDVAAALLPRLSSLVAAPLLRVCPQLQAMSAPPGVPAVPTAEALPLVLTSLKALAALPKALGEPAAALPWLPAPLLLALRLAHVAAAGRVDALSEPAVDAVKGLLAQLPPAHAPAPAGPAALVVARSATETALMLAAATPAAARLPLLHCALAGAALLPVEDGGCARTMASLHSALATLLAGNVAEQGAALSALQAELTRGAAAAATSGTGMPPPATLAHLRAMLPEVATLVHRSKQLESADKLGAVKLLLTSCVVAPPAALETMLSLTLPLLIGCLHVSVDGPASPKAKELATLAHSSITALAKRSPNEFRTAAANFSAETRTRMETAAREAAAAPTAPSTPGLSRGASGGALNTPGAAPKIALKMDFSAFGKK